MTDLLVRDIDPDVYERLRKAAKAQGKSLSQAVRDMLAEQVKPSKEEIWAEADRIRAMSPYSGIDSTDLIREDRDNDEPYR
ncbi:MAG: ribbon-helix-helix protein, CopG family [Variibacter sp.]|nr:ribbon-helix-helix protein, CopG family [Variibacter sp.]